MGVPKFFRWISERYPCLSELLEEYQYKNTGAKDIDDSEPAKRVKNAELEALNKLAEQEMVSDDDDEVEGWESYESDADDHEDSLFYLEFHQHKKDYYMNKLEYATVNSDVLRSQADGYVRAIQWNLHYYYNGVCSWSWFYPHHYAPYISDICNFSSTLELNYDMGTPFLPFQQLLAVLPAASKKLLPVPYQQLMVKEESPIFHYYPSEFKTDLNGKKQEWEAVVLIPFIDEVSLLDAMAPCDAMLTQEEHRRNSHGPMLIYTFAEQDLGVYDAPEFFPAVKHNHASALAATRHDIHVEHKHLVKGLCADVRLDVYFPGFPTLKHIPHTSKLQKCKVKVFEQPSQGYNMILQIVDQGKPDIKEVAMELLGRTIFVAWPHLVEARVVAVSNKEFQYGLRDDSGMGITPQFNIEEVKGTSQAQWGLQRRGIEEQYANRLGVQIGETNILVHATPLTGRKYVFGAMGKITLEKQWTEMPVAYALQTTVRDIAVHDRTFHQFKTLSEVFPPKSLCFMLGHPHYGAMGEVVDGGNTVKSGRVKVSMSVTPEPHLEGIRKQHHDSIVQYMAGNVAAQRLGVSSHLVSRITGTIYIIQGDKNASVESCSKVNVGLNLKFNKRNEEIPGYTRKEGSVWQYSNKAVDLVRNYMQNFPQLFDYLAKHTGNDVFYESDVFPSSTGCVTDISNWLKEQPYTKVERHVCGSEVLEAELVAAVEKHMDEFQQHGCRVKTVTMQVKPHLLYKPELQVGNIAPDPSASHRVFDRIVNVRDSYTVPLGLKGTIIGIHHADNDADLMYDVVFDKAFPGGMALNCSESRGYRIPKPAMLNLSHGQRVEQVKTVNKPTAVVQPSGNAVMQDNYWNQCHMSAFARWNNSPQPVQVVPSSLAGPQLYRALQQPSFSLMGTSRPQNPASARKPKQNYSSPMNKVPSSAPTEFQAIWTQLQKSTTSPQKPNQSTPPGPAPAPSSAEVAGDTGTELLKKMLRISEDSPHQPKHNTKPVSVDDIFQHARVTTPSKDVPLQGYCVQLLSYFQQKGYGIPRYNYMNSMENGKVRAQVVLPDTRAFSGEFSNSREQASESAARIALSALSVDPSHTKPGTNTLPIPPQQWYQQQSPQHYAAQGYHHARQDGTPDWRRGPGPDMMKPFKSMTQPPFVFPQYQPQQHWRGNGMANSSPNWRQGYQQQQPLQCATRQQEWHGTNWRQEDPQKKFVPLQAVKQQRNKPRQQPNQAPAIEQKPITNKTSETAENVETKIENKMTSSFETGRPSSNSNTVVSRPRKSRLAANFNVSLDSQ